MYSQLCICTCLKSGSRLGEQEWVMSFCVSSALLWGPWWRPPWLIHKAAAISRQHQSAAAPMTFSALNNAQNSSFIWLQWGWNERLWPVLSSFQLHRINHVERAGVRLGVRWRFVDQVFIWTLCIYMTAHIKWARAKSSCASGSICASLLTCWLPSWRHKY